MNLTRTATTVESDNLPRSHSYRENYKQLKNTEIGKKSSSPGKSTTFAFSIPIGQSGKYTYKKHYTG